MAQDTNLPITNPGDNFDQRVQDYFANYISAPIELTDQEYEAVKSFFIARTNSEESAASLTAAVIEAANNLNLFVLDVLDQFSNTADLKSAVPTFLNMSRRGTTLLGYEANITPNENIARQVEA